jgi:hypothetical protein
VISTDGDQGLFEIMALGIPFLVTNCCSSQGSESSDTRRNPIGLIMYSRNSIAWRSPCHLSRPRSQDFLASRHAHHAGALIKELVSAHRHVTHVDSNINWRNRKYYVSCFMTSPIWHISTATLPRNRRPLKLGHHGRSASLGHLGGLSQIVKYRHSPRYYTTDLRRLVPTVL